MFGIDTMFWVGITVVGLFVTIFCLVAWLLPPKAEKNNNG